MSIGIVNRTLGAGVMALMVLGSFGLWIGVPAGILWILGKLVESKSEHLLLALIAVPTGMALFALLLFRLNALYLRVNGYTLTKSSGEDDDEEWLPDVRGPLDRILGVCAIIALVGFFAWMLFAEGPVVGPAGPP